MLVIFFSEFMNPGGRRWLSVTEIPHTSSRNSALEYSSVSFPYQMLLHWWPHLEDSSAEHQVFFTRGFFDGSAESSQQMLQHDIYGPPKEIPPVVPTLLTHNWPLRYHWVIVLLIAYSYNQPQKKRTTIIFNIIFWDFYLEQNCLCTVDCWLENWLETQNHPNATYSMAGRNQISFQGSFSLHGRGLKLCVGNINLTFGFGWYWYKKWKLCVRTLQW